MEEENSHISWCSLLGTYLGHRECDVQQICSSDHPFLPIGNSGTVITCLRRIKERAPRRKGESGSLYAESLWAECTMMRQGNLGGL
jgi:hypothetical protein